MTKSISNDLRKRILNAVLEGMSARAAAIRYDVSASVAVKLVQRWRATGEYKPLPRGGYRRAVLDQEREYLHELLKKHADWSEVELAAHLREARGIELHASNVGRFIRKLGYRYKKTVFASEREREDVQEARAIWEEWQQTCDISKLVFLDETGTTTDLARVYGRSLAGTRLVDHVPGGHWNTMTFIAGLRMDRLIAPWCLDGAMSGEAFKTYLATQLASTLQPGDIVICDNLACHKVAGVQDIIDATGATIRYLPPYSPDLNPIEQVFAKLKALLRKAMARSFDRLWKTIGQLIPLFTKQECQNYFSHAGYKYN